MAKRYVLLVADADLSENEKQDLAAVLERRHGKVKLISVDGNPRAVIVKTNNQVAPVLRDPENTLIIGGKTLKTVLTSGAVVNLKRRASEAHSNGEVHER
ncbi:MAG: hypothetical protein KGI38_05100 [Thaumarchaeota archaeon]|nr:hypothetical protein [Nitrososphaerota archaeon]